MEERQQLTINRPPDFIFKYRKISRFTPSTEIIQDGQGTFNFLGVKYPAIYRESDEFFKQTGWNREWFKYPVQFKENQIVVFNEYPALTEEEEKMGGQLSCFSDVPYPYKGHPFPEALYFVNVAKRFSRHLVDLIMSRSMIPFFVVYFFLTKKRKISIIEHLLNTYADVCRGAMDSYILDRKFMTKYGREIYDFVARFLKKLGVNEDKADKFSEYFTAQIDWDNAYWMRIGDVMATTTKEKLLENPREELLKMGRLLIERNPQDPRTSQRLYKALVLVSKILFIPKYKRIFNECIEESVFENFQFDAGDNYHCLLYADYNYLGLTLEKRLEMYNNYHKEHPPLPQRLILKPQ